jgi:receptor expression-enhancing protein 5/6
MKLPQTKGAKFLYDSFLKDFLKKNESRIDAALANAKKTAGAVAADVTAAANDLADAVETKKDT